MDGFLNFCKPLGWTSHDVVQLVRRRLRWRRVGHAGTLDPAASGVLPICLGRATRLADRVSEGSKLYVADVKLGVVTDTCDAEGRLLSSGGSAPTELDEVVLALARLLGPQDQHPPAFSARKVSGEPAHRRARRGETVRLAPRPVTVHGLAVLSWEPPLLSIALRCSKGTYVRALARDLGTALGCGAHLDSLARLSVGPFTLWEAVNLDEFERAVAENRWTELVLPPDRVLTELRAAVLGEDKIAHLLHGRSWPGPGRPGLDQVRAYSTAGRFLGLLKARDTGAVWQPALSFVYDAGGAARG